MGHRGALAAGAEVSGDFYDFIHLDNGCLGVIIADVTDKGVPTRAGDGDHAHIVTQQRSDSWRRAMCAGARMTHSARTSRLRCSSPACGSPSSTPASGHAAANAGHDMPYVRRTAGGIEELWARGMPLGLLPGMPYEEKEKRATG